MLAVLPTGCCSTILFTALGLIALPRTTAASGQTHSGGTPPATADLARTDAPRATTAFAPLPLPAPDRVSATTLDGLRRALGSGDVVSIVWTTGEPVRARVLRVGDTDLDIRTDSAQAAGERLEPLTIPLAAIQWLERPPDSVRNGTLIGAGVGAGVGLAFFAHAMAVDRNEMDEWAAGYLLGSCISTGIGALVGLAIDALHSKPHLRYDAPRASGSAVRVSPLLSRRAGVTVAVSF